MSLNSEWTKKTLAHNLRWIRRDLNLSQLEFSRKVGVSYRLIQEIEASKANPTIETLGFLADSLQVSLEFLLKLFRVKLDMDSKQFLINYKNEFANRKIGVVLRTLQGETIWGNRKAEQIRGQAGLRSNRTNLFEFLDAEAQGVLRGALASEAQGKPFPYTIFVASKNKKTRHCIRCHPTLIYPNQTIGSPLTSVFFVEFEEDFYSNYYSYCQGLFRAIRKSAKGRRIEKKTRK